MLKRSARDPAGSCCRPQVENHCLPGTGRGNLQVWSNRPLRALWPPSKSETWIEIIFLPLCNISFSRNEFS